MDSCSTAWTYDIELPALARSACTARAFVERVLVQHDLQDLVDDARVVVGELVTNALKHANTPFTVTVAAAGASVRVEVQDGSGSLPVLTVAGCADTSGRGIALVDVLSSEWGVTPHIGVGKTVWASFDAKVLA